MVADYSFDVKNIDIWAPAFFKHNNSFIATVLSITQSILCKIYQQPKNVKYVRVFIYHSIRFSLILNTLLQWSVPEGAGGPALSVNARILSIFPAIVHQFYANILVFVNINPFLYINDQFALIDCNWFFSVFQTWIKLAKDHYSAVVLELA